MKTYFMAKRLFDLLISVVAIMFLCPVLLIVAVIIRVQSLGPIFYRGLRIGINGKPFRIFKFRTMVVNAEELGGPSTALNDSRLIPIGKFLRKYKLDELPQFLNVLKGDMSIVGPRPQVERYTKLYNEEEKSILSVKPGLTDYASIKFINLDSLLGDEAVDEKYMKQIEPEKNKLRLKYVKESSMAVDFKIILQTVRCFLRVNAYGV